MNIFLIKAFSFLKSLLPRAVITRLDPENYAIGNFINEISKEIEEKERVLDAGAGSQPFKNLFNHCDYESTDIKQVYDKQNEPVHNFTCSLDKIPVDDNRYDAIISTQVLEHVENPGKVIEEFYRVLAPGGSLYLTVPQGWGVHEAPHHYFNFTNFGLEKLFKDANFKIAYIKPRGGIFWDLSKRLSHLPHYILYQHMLSGKKGFISLLINKLKFLIIVAIFILTVPFFYFFIPLLFFFLDKLDYKKDFTLGYACKCVKPIN